MKKEKKDVIEKYSPVLLLLILYVIALNFSAQSGVEEVFKHTAVVFAMAFVIKAAKYASN